MHHFDLYVGWMCDIRDGQWTGLWCYQNSSETTQSTCCCLHIPVYVYASGKLALKCRLFGNEFILTKKINLYDFVCISSQIFWVIISSVRQQVNKLQIWPNSLPLVNLFTKASFRSFPLWRVFLLFKWTIREAKYVIH